MLGPMQRALCRLMGELENSDQGSEIKFTSLLWLDVN